MIVRLKEEGKLIEIFFLTFSDTNEQCVSSHLNQNKLTNK